MVNPIETWMCGVCGEHYDDGFEAEVCCDPEYVEKRRPRRGREVRR